MPEGTKWSSRVKLPIGKLSHVIVVLELANLTQYDLETLRSRTSRTNSEQYSTQQHTNLRLNLDTPQSQSQWVSPTSYLTLACPVSLASLWEEAPLNSDPVLNSWLTTRSYITGSVAHLMKNHPYPFLLQLPDEKNLVRVEEAA